MDDAYVCLPLLAAVVLVAMALAIFIHNTHSPKRKNTTMYYIDGTVDSIEITLNEKHHLHFTLLPSSEFLKTVGEGRQKALFIGTIEPATKQTDEVKTKQPDGQTKVQNPIRALLVDMVKNANGKETLRFLMPQMCAIFRRLLLEAKNNRNIIRVLAKSKEQMSEQLCIDFDAPVSITIL